MKHPFLYRILFLIACLPLLACNLSGRLAQPSPTPSSSPTPLPPTETPVPPTATPAPTATLADTPAPAVPAATAASTNTPVVTAALPTGYAKYQVLGAGASPFTQDVSGSVASGTFDRYEVTMTANGGLDIRLTSPQNTAGFTVLGPDQQPLRGSENAEARWWSSSVTQAGVYAILVGSELGRAEYTLSVKTTTAGGTTGGAFSALEAKDCRQLQNQAQGALGVNFSQSRGNFNSGKGESGTACVLAANGTGVDFKSVEAVLKALQSAFGEWNLDASVAADEASGSARGYRNDDELMLVSVQWRPAAEANCPQGQPIANCTVKPKQRLFTILIQAATK